MPTTYNVKKARERAGLSQKALAAKLGITQQSVWYYENGERDIKASVLVQLSDVLGVTISYLLGLTDKPTETAIPTQEQADPALARLIANYTSMTAEGRSALVATSAALAAQFPQVASGVSAEKSA